MHDKNVEISQKESIFLSEKAFSLVKRFITHYAFGWKIWPLQVGIGTKKLTDQQADDA